ncbi:NRDE family protein [Pelagicoccus sp. SDUM812003]|uniref:NRDE family protein n=1 Tax=Pelagicoccus sp. SDUM812003 TaxID=3041267 RepID=UPI00280CFBB7|nr:NRDE family protein [Pelagicoccus sp. SDUM812003]MDQ8203271.1 NRDE family protein [Pelagicoccus sp. SDUM812003]
MCTASWSVSATEATLCFNRDERKIRPEAEALAAHESENGKLLFARDPQGGGTWLCANEAGLCSFLLNNYGATAKLALQRKRFSGGRSRGDLTIGCCQQASLPGAERWLRSLDLDSYKPFLLGLMSLGNSVVLSWDGCRIVRLASDIRFLTTSSFQTEEVEAYRKNRYIEICGDDASLCSLRRRISYHFDTAHPSSAYNPLMRREESETQCVTMVSIRKTSTLMRLQTRPFEVDGFEGGQEMELERAAPELRE